MPDWQVKDMGNAAMGMLGRISASVSALLILGEAIRYGLSAFTITLQTALEIAIAAGVLLIPPVILLRQTRAGPVLEATSLAYPIFLGGGFLLAIWTAHPLGYALWILTVMMPTAGVYSCVLLLAGRFLRLRDA